MLRQPPPPKPKDKVVEPLVIHWRIDAWFPDLGPKAKVLKRYHEELLSVNKSINLIGPNSISNADLIHFADSILASRAIHKSSAGHEIFDIGSGNGFPGLVYSVLFPDVKVHLVDNDPRKAEFLRNMIRVLDLKNTDVIEKAFEALPAESMKYAMSRGLAAIPKALLLARKPLKVNGVFYSVKGTEWPLEIAEMPTQLCSFWNSGLISEYSLPVGDLKFFVVGSEKIKN